MTKTWFTSDHHFGHANIIRHAKRPFSSVEEMDERMIELWNSVVGPRDVVHHLGDLVFRASRERATELLSRLHGHKFLIRGNHDRVSGQLVKIFGWVKDLHELKVPVDGGKQRIVLCHYALRTWNGSHHGTWHLHGHSHGTLAEDPYALSMDVGVDTHGFVPWSYEEIRERMASRTFVPVDHHGADAEEDDDEEER